MEIIVRKTDICTSLYRQPGPSHLSELNPEEVFSEKETYFTNKEIDAEAK